LYKCVINPITNPNLVDNHLTSDNWCQKWLIGDCRKKICGHTVKMEEIMARLKAEIRTNREEIRAGQQRQKAEMRAHQEFLKEEMLAKLDASHERLMFSMDSELEKLETCL
jgi:hypothetical protein